MSVHIAFDTETTGLDPRHNEAIEIGAVLMQESTLCPTSESFNIKLKIEKPDRVTPNTLGVYNHYDAAVWDREAVSQAEGWTKFCDWVFKVSGGGANRAILVGQNIVGFDYPLMDHWTKQFGLKPSVSYHPEDLMYLYYNIRRRLRMKIPKSNLAVIAEFFGIVNMKSHSALEDAQVAAACYALGEAYLDIMIDCGRIDHNSILNEAWHRIGFPRYQGYVPLKTRN